MFVKIKRALALIGPYPYNPYLIFLLFFSFQFSRFATLLLEESQGLERYKAALFILLLSMPPAFCFASLAYLYTKYRFWSSKSLVAYILEVALAQSFQLLYFPVTRPILIERFDYDLPPALTVTSSSFIISLILILFALYVMHRAERSIFDRLQQANLLVTQLKADREELVNLDEAIRRQTSTFLHDRVQSDLMVIGMKLKSIQGASSAEVNEVIDRAIARLENTRAADLKNIIQVLSPNFEVGGLKGSIDSLIKQYESNMAISVQVNSISEDLDALYLLGAYRILEQGLLNSFIHGPARNVLVSIGTDSAGRTEIVVSDDGPGTDLDFIESGVGTAVIDSWVGILGGKKTVETVPGHGYLLRVVFPA
jgi:signal transduction histidine kinase